MMEFVGKIKRKINCFNVHHILHCSGKIKCYGNVNILNKNVHLGDNIVLYPNVSFEGSGQIIIEDNVKIGTNTIIYAGKNGGVIIRKNTIVAGNCYIIDTNHGTKAGELISEQNLDSSKVVIGSDVWIGANVSVIKGSEISDGAVIGANSLVNGFIPANAIAVGAPTHILKYRGE